MFHEIFIVSFILCSLFASINGHSRSTTMKNNNIDALVESTTRDYLTIRSEALKSKKNETVICPANLDKPCFSMCCPIGTRFVDVGKCLPLKRPSSAKFPRVYDAFTREMLPDEIRIEDFHIFPWDPCDGGDRYVLDDHFMFLSNGSIYDTASDLYLDFGSYCFAAIGAKIYRVFVCLFGTSRKSVDDQSTSEDHVNGAVPFGMILSVPFFILTFIVYTVIPELRNMHGSTLRGYVASLVVAYTFLAYLQIRPDKAIDSLVCISMAFVIQFSFLSSFFWLNVMCFDIWWTFRSMQGTVKQGEKKKFIMYSIYAWGNASLLIGLTIIMDYFPGIPDSFIKPNIGVKSCWFSSDSAIALYFYGPMGVTVLCNIFFFISTTLTIIRHKKDTAHHLTGTDSRRHDDTKQWFNVYLKLFIVMGITWSMEIISWLFKNSSKYIWYITDTTNALQGVIIFIIFVWKDKTKRLVLKRLGYQNGNFQSSNSTRSANHRSTSRTCADKAAQIPLQDKNNSNAERNIEATDETDCV